MLRNYLISAWRHLVRHRLYAGINIAGLAIGFASCLLILRFVQDEFRYDHHHEQAAQIYRVVGPEYALTPGLLAPTLQEGFPQVEKAARISFARQVLVRSGDRRFFEARFHYGDHTLFEKWLETLGIELLEGRSFRPGEQGVAIVNQALVAEFGLDDPVGKKLDLGPFPTTVGVVKDFHLLPLRQGIGPLLLRPLQEAFRPDFPDYLFVRIRPEEIAGTLTFLRRAWERIAPDLPFAYTFLDEEIARLYQAENAGGRSSAGPRCWPPCSPAWGSSA